MGGAKQRSAWKADRRTRGVHAVRQDSAMTDRLLIAHGLVLADPAQPAALADLWIEDGVIREIGAPGRFDSAEGARRIDASDTS